MGTELVCPPQARFCATVSHVRATVVPQPARPAVSRGALQATSVWVAIAVFRQRSIVVGSIVRLQTADTVALGQTKQQVISHLRAIGLQIRVSTMRFSVIALESARPVRSVASLWATAVLLVIGIPLARHPLLASPSRPTPKKVSICFAT
jgi:hypothetical protein